MRFLCFDAVRQKMDIDPVSGAELQKLAAEFVALPQDGSNARVNWSRIFANKLLVRCNRRQAGEDSSRLGILITSPSNCFAPCQIIALINEGYFDNLVRLSTV